MFPFFSKRREIVYIIEQANWSIRWDGFYITSHIKQIPNVPIRMSHDWLPIKRSLLHFGSRNLYLPEKFRRIHKSNSVIFTWFHYGSDQPSAYTKDLPEGSRRADLIHTSCQISKQQLVYWGAQEEKIVVIPLGVDLQLFCPITAEEKVRRRKLLGIPEHAIVIGSFQKDGNGWGEGNTPKLIKGPDVFCDTVIRLQHRHRHPVYVFLTGPARGYVKKRLSEHHVPFKHVYTEDYRKIGDYFPLLDLYIVASRCEGGPKAVLESMASGVPLISTKVGMAPDIVTHGQNGFLAEIENIEELSSYAEKILDDTALREHIVKNGLKTAQHFGWETIARYYYEKMYAPLL